MWLLEISCNWNRASMQTETWPFLSIFDKSTCWNIFRNYLCALSLNVKQGPEALCGRNFLGGIWMLLKSCSQTAKQQFSLPSRPIICQCSLKMGPLLDWKEARFCCPGWGPVHQQLSLPALVVVFLRGQLHQPTTSTSRGSCTRRPTPSFLSSSLFSLLLPLLPKLASCDLVWHVVDASDCLVIIWWPTEILCRRPETDLESTSEVGPPPFWSQCDWLI